MQPHTEQIVWIIFTAVTSIGVLIQASVLLAIFLATRRAGRQAHELADQLKQHLVPAIVTARNLIEDVAPKLKVAAANLAETSHKLRSQTDHINKTVSHVANLAEAQAVRVDEMATAVLDGVTHATAAVQHGISAPMRQVTGVLNGLKAGLEVLWKKERPTHVEGDGSKPDLT